MTSNVDPPFTPDEAKLLRMSPQLMRGGKLIVPRAQLAEGIRVYRAFLDRDPASITACPLPSPELHIPGPLPAAWSKSGSSRETRAVYFSRRGLGPSLGLAVGVSVSLEEDDNLWMELDLTRLHRDPDWEDISIAKHLFVGDDRWAVQVLPSRRDYFTVPASSLGAEHCMVLWSPRHFQPFASLFTGEQAKPEPAPVPFPGLSVGTSRLSDGEGRTWVHVEVARRSRLPTWQDLVNVQRHLFGDERYAFQLFPPAHIFDPGKRLHFWVPLFPPPYPAPNFLRARGGAL